MQPLREIRHHLAGLWLLAWGDGRGLSAFDISDQGVLRSFQAMLFCLPGLVLYAIQRRIDYLQVAADPSSGHVWFLLRALFLALSVWSIALAIIVLAGWLLGYRPVLRSLIVMFNWAAVPFVYITHGIVYPLMSVLGSNLTLTWLLRLLLGTTAPSITAYLTWCILHTVVGAEWWKRLTFLVVVVVMTFWIAHTLETSLGLTIP